MAQGIEKLLQIAEGNEDLRKEIGESAKAALAIEKSLVALGAKHGCDFTSEDAAAFLAVVRAESGGSELDDSQLAGVSGGGGALQTTTISSSTQLSSLRTSVRNLDQKIQPTGGGVVARW